MKLDDFFSPIMGSLISIGSVVCVVLWVKNLFEDVGAKVTGIWVNHDSSLRLLVYTIDSVIQGDVVWAGPQNRNILGQSVLQNVKLNFFLFGKGKYLDPFTNVEYDFRLRVLSSDSMQLYLMDKEGRLVDNETWSLVK